MLGYNRDRSRSNSGGGNSVNTTGQELPILLPNHKNSRRSSVKGMPGRPEKHVRSYSSGDVAVGEVEKDVSPLLQRPAHARSMQALQRTRSRTLSNCTPSMAKSRGADAFLRDADGYPADYREAQDLEEGNDGSISSSNASGAKRSNGSKGSKEESEEDYIQVEEDGEEDEFDDFESDDADEYDDEDSLSYDDLRYLFEPFFVFLRAAITAGYHQENEERH